MAADVPLALEMSLPAKTKQRYKSVLNSFFFLSPDRVSDDDALEPIVLNTDNSQIKYSLQELNCPSWDTATLIKSISRFINAVSGAEARSTDPK